MDNSHENFIKDCIESARPHVISVEWDKPEIVAGLKKGLEKAFQVMEEGDHSFAPLAEKDFTDEEIRLLNTVLVNDYYLKMNFWECVAFMLEAKVRALETILSHRTGVHVHS